MIENYAAYVLQPTSHERITDLFVPRHPHVVAHHVTWKYPAERADLPPMPEKVTIVGHHVDDRIEVLVVEVDGKRHQAPRADGRKWYLHITHSRRDDVKDVESNDLLWKIVAEKGEEALYNLPPEKRVEVNVVPRFIRSLKTIEVDFVRKSG